MKDIDNSMSADNNLNCIEIETAAHTHSTVIWLHGLGADGNDFVPIISELHMPPELGLRFIFPNAPMMPVTINNGYVMRAWYDILGFTPTSPIDYAGINQSVNQINQLIQNEIARGIAPDKIILAGFSQGAVMAMTCGLQFDLPLAGIIAISGYLPFTEESLLVKHAVPVFLGHGQQDDVVPFPLSMHATALLQAKHIPVTYKSYPVGHNVCPTEINDIQQWLKERLRK